MDRSQKKENSHVSKKSCGQKIFSDLPQTVIALGLVSLFTDLSSEMIYPLLPVFLASVLGATAISLGIIEGIAESTAAILKVASGIWSDRLKKRKPLIVTGYGLSGIVRPTIGLATTWPFVLVMRFLDRMGKGIRSSPRDALIANVTDLSIRGKAFGFHRAMDHAGAVLGPLAAAVLLTINGVTLRHVFLFALVPSIVVIVILSVGLKETPSTTEKISSPNFTLKWGELSSDYKRFLFAIFIFTLGNSTDAFLLWRLAEAGTASKTIALLWSAHHIVKMISTYVGGQLSDKKGRRSLILCGWGIYVAIYLGFAFVQNKLWLIVLFLSYGLYFGLTEPTERAWVVDLVPKESRGTAFGYYHGVIGLSALPASLMFGLIWQTMGAQTAFIVGASLAALASLFLLRVPPKNT